MNAVTYAGVSGRRIAVAERTKGGPRRSFFARFMGALRESRIRQARRVIEKHAHLIASEQDAIR
jgi:hypothetical protein